MSRTTLIEIQPRRPDGTVETLRLVDRSPRAAAYLGAQWLPLVTELPGFEMAIGFDGQRFGAQPSPQIGALAFALAPEIRAAAGWVWRDAPVTIRQADWPIDGSNPADGAFTITWTGNASAFSSGDGVARVELIDKGQLLRVPVAPLRFGSTGIALLDAAAAARDRQAGQVVPVAFGRVLNLPGLLVDRANNIWLFAAQPAASVQAFYDGGVAFSAGSARASLAALQGTSPAAGTVDWCLNAGGLLLARPADRPVYPFTCDATFGSAALGDVMAAIVGGRLSIWPGEVAALNGLGGSGLGECGLYIDDESTVAEALDRLFAGLAIFWKVGTDGLLRAFRMAWAAPVASFAPHQRHAPSRLQTILPTARRQLGYATNNRVHGEGEIARILLATDLAYADGTPIEALKPAQAAATSGAPTGTNVAGVPAATLVADAATAKADGASALSQLANISADGVLAAVEKKFVRQRRDIIIEQYPLWRDRADALGVSRAALTTAYTNLISYLAALVPSLESASETAIVRATFDGRFKDYADLLDEVITETVSVASQRANLLTGNAVVNSEFARGTYGFEFALNTYAGPLLPIFGGVNLSPSWSGIKNVMWANVGTGGANWSAAGEADPFSTAGRWVGGGMTEQRLFGLPVKAGDRVYARCLLARHRCNAQFYMLIYDKDGNLLEAPSWIGGRSMGAGGGDPANFDVVGGTHVVSNPLAVSAGLMWRMLSTGEAEPYIFMAEPAMGIVPSYQTTLPPYQLGNADPLADKTSLNTSADTAQVGGVPSATVLSGISAAQAAAANAQATADGKIDTFLQPAMPSGTLGDLWIDTYDNNRLYRHDGSTFVVADDQRIGAALVAAAGAQATADGKVRTFYGASTPVDPDLGDLWAIPGEQRLRRFNGSAFEVVVEFIANARTSFALSTPASGSFVQIGIGTLGVGPNGTIQISATIDYVPSPGFGAVSGAIEVTVDWRPVPGTGAWTQIGASQVGSTASRAPDIDPGIEPGDVTPGSVTIVRNLAGPASVANQEFRVTGRLTGTALSAFGTAQAIVSWVPA